jgi:hypothetical protein
VIFMVGFNKYFLVPALIICFTLFSALETFVHAVDIPLFYAL